MKIDKNATIVDVRTPGEFKEKHFPGSINIPLDQVSKRISEFRDFSKPLILYCKSGNRSGMAVAMLKQHGINDAVNGGGLSDMLASKTEE